MSEPLTQDIRLASLYQLVQDEVWHDALTLATSLLQETTLAASAHAMLAVIHDKQGHGEEAVAHCRQALALCPEDALTLFNLGTLLAQHDQLDEAVTCLEQAVQHADAWAMAHYNLGTVLLRLERYREAIGALECALKHCHVYPEAQFNCGNAHALVALRRDGTLDYYELDCAITAYKAAIQQRPGYMAALYNLGMLYQCTYSTEGLHVWEQYLKAAQDLTDEEVWRRRAVEYQRDLQEHKRSGR